MADSRLTPALLDLMEYEKAIEQGLTAIGWNLRAIRDGGKYRAAGYTTFEDYVEQRWNHNRDWAYKQIAAANNVDAIEAGVSLGDTPAPTSEKQVRPLSLLPEAERAEAWVEAVDEARGQQPTEAGVRAVVARRRTQSGEHPAVFSTSIISNVVELLEPLSLSRILDPFAGTGRVHDIADKLGVDSVGVELEPEWANMHERTVCADARQIARKVVGRFDCVVTSPCYGNRMADHHEARDDSDRATYRHRLGRKLTEGSGAGMQWGDEYKVFHLTVWRTVARLLEPGGLFVLNVKDHVRDGGRVAVSGWHVRTLLDQGLSYVDDNAVATRGLGGAGDNAESREGVEHVYLFWKTS